MKIQHPLADPHVFKRELLCGSSATMNIEGGYFLIHEKPKFFDFFKKDINFGTIFYCTLPVGTSIGPDGVPNAEFSYWVAKVKHISATQPDQLSAIKCLPLDSWYVAMDIMSHTAVDLSSKEYRLLARQLQIQHRPDVIVKDDNAKYFQYVTSTPDIAPIPKDIDF